MKSCDNCGIGIKGEDCPIDDVVAKSWDTSKGSCSKWEETSKLGDVIQEPYDYNPKQLERTVKYFQQRIKESLGEAGDEIEEFLPVGIVTAKVRTKHINAFGWILDDSV